MTKAAADRRIKRDHPSTRSYVRGRPSFPDHSGPHAGPMRLLRSGGLCQLEAGAALQTLDRPACARPAAMGAGE